MSQIPKKLIKIVISSLIENSEEEFIDNLTEVISQNDSMLNYLCEGPLKIDDEVTVKIKDALINTLANPESLIRIISIKNSFDYSFRRIYSVTYLATKYFDQHNKPYGGLDIMDEEHPIPKPVKCNWDIKPNELEDAGY